MIWMALMWTVEAVPLAVTSIIPIFAFPLLGLMESHKVATFYLNDIGFLLLSSLSIAAAVETSNLHQRISLKTLLTVGTSTYRLVLGTMAVTMFLSMWIPNTASASIMGPVALSVIDQIFQSDLPTVNPLMEKMPEGRSHSQRIRCLMMLAVAYAANVGGTGSIIGTGPNLVLKAQLDELYPGSTEVTFGTWMMYNAPVMVINTFLGYLFLCVLIRSALKNVKVNKDSERSIRRSLQEKYDRLGPMTFAEKVVLVILSFTIVVWFTMRPQFVKGWADYISYGRTIKATAPAVLLTLLLFVIPKDPTDPKKMEPILTWSVLNSKMQWGVMLLLGGGLALADLCKVTGLSKMIATQLLSLHQLPSYVTLAILTFSASMLTEVTSNTAISSIMLPVVSQIAVAIRVNPIYLMMPIAVACSFSFMLPAATPVNAIVYDLGEMTIPQMAIPGIFMNIICVAVEVVMMNISGNWVFGVDQFPSWAEPSNTTISMAL